MSDPLRIAIAGLGTVGAGTINVLNSHAEALAQRSGRALEVVAVSARSRTRERDCDISALQWWDDAVAMAREAEVDVVLELVGGEDGPAKAVCEGAMAAGRHVVTANKALLAHHGTALAQAAEANGVELHYEAAVAGGIPIVKALREGLAGNGIKRVYGILNGTCNYILTAMRDSGRDFDSVLAEAQELGYAEAEPSMDVDGVDTAHKLAILASLAYRTEIDFGAVFVEGIRRIAPLDITFADELGYRIKLLGSARMTPHGLEQRVHPCMVAADTPIAHVGGVFNAVVARGDFVDDAVFEGRGAGAGPTASAVVADIVDIAAGRRTPALGVPCSTLTKATPAAMEHHVGAYYLRFMVQDRAGVIADITSAFRDADVSIESMLQRGRDDVVPVVMTTHETQEARMQQALASIAGLAAVMEPPNMIRIEHL